MPIDHIIFIHGRGKSASRDHAWLDGLRFGLASAGHDVGRDRLEKMACRPSYTTYLDRHVKYEPQGNDRPVRSVPAEAVERYRREMTEISEIIGPGFPNDRAAGAIKQVTQKKRISDYVVSRRFDDVERYLKDTGRREKIRQVILDQIPSSGRCVLIGHSLGSVVTIDLLPHLPPELSVELLLTIGSPGRIPLVERELSRTAETFPYERIRSWVNFYDANDVVTGACGLAEQLARDPSVFEGLAHDHQVENGGVKASHDADRYLAHLWVGELVGRRLGTADSAVPGLPDDPVILAAWFEASAHAHIRRELIRKRREQRLGSSLEAGMRLADAHLTVTANRDLGLSPRARLVDAVDDLAEALAKCLEDSELGKTAGLDLQMQLFGAPPFADWGLKVGKSLMRPVVVETSERFDWPAQRITNILEALEKARTCQKKKDSGLPNELVVGGAVVLLAAMATGGAALIAAPGVAGAAAGSAGAAAISSSLASLGGVVGGGMAAGLSVSIGSGAVGGAAISALALRSLESARVVGEVVKSHALALVHRWEGRIGEHDRILHELRVLRDDAERQLRIRRSVVRGDDDAPAVREWKAKRDALRAAVKGLE